MSSVETDTPVLINECSDHWDGLQVVKRNNTNHLILYIQVRHLYDPDNWGNLENTKVLDFSDLLIKHNFDVGF